MTDEKYTDEEIVRALECCANNEKDNTCKYCRECPASYWELDDEECDCMHSMYTRSISIINRQKAEIAWLRNTITGYEKMAEESHEYNKTISKLLDDIARMITVHDQKVRAEAIEEFVERLKGHIVQTCCVVTDDVDSIYKEINKIAKELTEGIQ